MTVQIVQFTADADQAEEIEQALRAMVAGIQEAQPAGTRFTSWKLADGRTFVNVLELDDGVENPLPGIPACQAYRRQLATWFAEPPAPQPVTVVGAYDALVAGLGSGSPG